MTRPITVAITSVRGADAPSPGLVVAQTLRRQTALDVRIMALATDPFVEGLQGLPAADHVVIVPSLDRDPAGFLACLRRLVREAAPVVLAPGSPRDVLLLSPHRAALARLSVRVLLPAERWLSALPFPPVGRRTLVPRHVVLGGRDRVHTLRGGWRYPVRVRWADGVVTVGRTLRELRAQLDARHHESLTAGVYESVTGVEIGVAAVSAGKRQSDIVAARLLTVSEKGCVWSAVTMTDPEVLATARRVLGSLRCPGAMEARFVLDTRGRLWFVGLVPGFPSWVSLAAAAGHDLVTDYVRLALGVAPAATTRGSNRMLLSRVSVDYPTTIETLTCLATQGEFRHASSRR